MKKLILFLGVALTVGLGLSSFTADPPKKVIVIDAGHGGVDLGISNKEGNSVNEKDLTLKIAEMIKANNKNPNVEIILLRDSDEMVELAKRSNKINEINPTAFISIHLNSALNNSEMKGYEVFYSSLNSQSEASKRIGNILLENYKSIGLENRGLKDQKFHILRETQVPGVIFEVAFLSNKEDFDFVNQKENQEIIANNILASIEKF